MTLSLFGKRSLRKAMRKLDEHQHDQVYDEQGLLRVDEGYEGPDQEQEQHQNRLDRDLEAAVDRAGAHPVSVAMMESVESVSNTGDLMETTIAVVEAPVPTGFTRGEKWTFLVIAIVAVINVSVCVPLYYHYAGQESAL